MGKVVATFFFFVVSTWSLLTAVPDPLSLSPGWYEDWVSDTSLSDEAELLAAELTSLQEELNPQSQALLVLQVKQTKQALDKLVKLAEASPSYKVVQPLYLETYSLSDLLLTRSRLRNVNNFLQTLDLQLDKLHKTQSNLRERLDFLLLEYNTQPQASVERLQLGLTILETRFSLEGTKKQQILLQKQRSAAEENLIKLDAEQQLAKKRLHTDETMLNDVNDRLALLKEKEIETTQQLLETDKELPLLNRQIQLQILRGRQLLEKIKRAFVINIDPKKAEGFLRSLQQIYHSLGDFHDNAQTYATQLGSLSEEQLLLIQSVNEKLDFLEKQKEDTELALELLQEHTNALLPGNKRWLASFVRPMRDFVTEVSNLLFLPLFRVNEQAITLWVLLRAIVIVCSSIVIGRMLLRWLKTIRRLRQGIGRDNLYIISRIAYYAIQFAGILIAFYSLGFSMTNFLIIGGALGVGIGLGLQAIVNNFFSGLVVLFSKILKLGDVVETKDGLKGVVRAINMQNIHIHTFDGKDIVLPNADLVTKRLVNWTMADPYVRLHIPFDVAYGSDQEKVDKIVTALASKIEYSITNPQLSPPPKVWLKELGASAIHLELAVWVNVRQFSSRGDMRTEYLRAIEKELLTNDIEIPNPQNDIHIRTFPSVTVDGPISVQQDA